MKNLIRDKSFFPPKQSAFAARYEAQKIAFGPVVFHCVRYAWKRGMLEALSKAGDAGLSMDQMEADGRWSGYALQVVMESCLSAGVVALTDGRWRLDKVGYCVLNDRVTQVNMNFVHDVCYKGLFELERSLDEQQPLGLAHMGSWSTIYEGLSSLEEPAKSSWFEFDHHYSDTSFPDILPDVFATAPLRVMDVGANTGKFSRAALDHDSRVELHLVDLPQQLAVARQTLEAAGIASRAHFHERDMLNERAALPGGMDLVWMSQFLSCFGESQIASIFRRVAHALSPQGQVLILDTLWDRQQYDIAAYCLINTSPYFTAMASGNSKVYRGSDYVRLAEAAGLRLLTTRDGIGYCHSLMRFAKA